MESATAKNLNMHGSMGRFPALVWWSVVGATIVIGILLYAAIIPDLALEWFTEDASSYGLLVPPIALYLAYARREEILANPALPDVRGLSLTAFACCLLLAGEVAAEFFLARISIVFLFAGVIWTFWGMKRLRTLTFPLILLCTMVPLPAIVFNTIAAPLQLLASRVATDVAQFAGTSVYRDGNIIHLANISLGVAEACSGLQSLTSLMVGSLLVGFLEGAPVPGRILLFMVAIPLAVAVNAVRVAGTAILADYRPEFAMGFYHSFSGWLVFVVGLGILWLSGKLVARLMRARS